jgi:hypothetical protein
LQEEQFGQQNFDNNVSEDELQEAQEEVRYEQVS